MAVPECDLAQRRREIAENIEDSGWMADTTERIIAADPVVTINQIDEYGVSWFDVELEATDEAHCHSLTILDDDSWELCD